MVAKHSINRFERYSYQSIAEGITPDSKGRLLMDGRGDSIQTHDMTDVTICNAAVDTVRQLYRGLIKPDFQTFISDEHPSELRLMGIPFAVNRMGKNSGYRLKFQNNDLGVIVLLGSYYKKIDCEGAHLKIELSPHFIAQRSAQVVDSYLKGLSQTVLDGYVPSGCAVHLAVDFQGYDVPQDIQQHFVTRSRFKSKHGGISEFDLTLDSVAYGDHQSYLFGKTTSLQSAIYRKDTEAIVRDKVDYWRETWTNYTFGAFDSEKPVWRVEMRLHHNCVRELGASIGTELEYWTDVYEVLTDLWQYAMTGNRLMLDKKLIHPLWQILTDDITISLPAKGYDLYRKKKQDISAVTRNIGLFLGNYITLMARKRATADMIYVSLKKMPIFADIKRYWASRGGLPAFRTWIEDSLNQRLLRGDAA